MTKLVIPHRFLLKVEYPQVHQDRIEYETIQGPVSMPGIYGEREESEFDRLLARVEPRREWGCDIDHDGPCNLACGEP